MKKEHTAAAGAFAAIRTWATGLCMLSACFLGLAMPTEAAGNGVYTEIGAMVQLAIAPGYSFQPASPPALVRVREWEGGIVLVSDRNAPEALADAGRVRIGGNVYSTYENKTGAKRVFISDSGEMLSVANAVLSVVVVLYDRGDTRRRRAVSGVAGGVAFPDVDQVVGWSLSRPLRLDPGALSQIDFGGGSGGSADCPVCHGTGRIVKFGGATYGQRVYCDECPRTTAHIHVPCPRCR